MPLVDDVLSYPKETADVILAAVGSECGNGQADEPIATSRERE
jgi:hypothetical protein